MFDGKEKELKILITKDQYEKLLHSNTFDEVIEQTNTYYDDDEGNLRSRSSAFRKRVTDSAVYYTLKRPLNENTKYEAEEKHPADDQSDLQTVFDRLNETDIPLSSDLHQVAQFHTTRNLIRTPEAEICLDKTVYPNHTDYEVEYEYMTNHDGIQKFNEFLNPVHMKYEKNGLSKLARAFQD